MKSTRDSVVLKLGIAEKLVVGTSSLAVATAGLCLFYDTCAGNITQILEQAQQYSQQVINDVLLSLYNGPTGY